MQIRKREGLDLEGKMLVPRVPPSGIRMNLKKIKHVMLFPVSRTGNVSVSLKDTLPK